MSDYVRQMVSPPSDVTMPTDALHPTALYGISTHLFCPNSSLILGGGGVQGGSNLFYCILDPTNTTMLVLLSFNNVANVSCIIIPKYVNSFSSNT